MIRTKKWWACLTKKERKELYRIERSKIGNPIYEDEEISSKNPRFCEICKISVHGDKCCRCEIKRLKILLKVNERVYDDKISRLIAELFRE